MSCDSEASVPAFVLICLLLLLSILLMPFFMVAAVLDRGEQ